MNHWKGTNRKIYFHDNHDEIDSSNVVSLKKDETGIRFREECDGYYWTWKSKQDAIKALEEAIVWIKEE